VIAYGIAGDGKCFLFILSTNFGARTHQGFINRKRKISKIVFTLEKIAIVLLFRVPHAYFLLHWREISENIPVYI
jgi:hypothetical protein